MAGRLPRDCAQWVSGGICRSADDGRRKRPATIGLAGGSHSGSTWDKKLFSRRLMTDRYLEKNYIREIVAEAEPARGFSPEEPAFVV